MKTLRKTISKGNFEYKRVKDDEAAKIVKEDKNWQYCSKMEWKQNSRDINKSS